MKCIIWQTHFGNSNTESWDRKKCYNILTLGFETTKRWNYIAEIPNTKGLSEHYKRRKAWSSEYISKILDQIQDDPILHLSLHLSFVCSLRAGEIVAIVARCQQGESVAALSNELAIPRSTLYRWIKSFPTDSAGKPLKFSYQEYALLQRKVEKLQNVITILKSVDCLVSAPLKERLYALEPFYGKYEIHTICEALDVDRGTFYNHMLRSKRGNAWFDKRRQEYCQLIRDVFDEYRQVLGAEKIRTILVQRGHQVSAEYVSRLMHEMGLSSVRTTAKQEYLKLREPERKKNILRQQFNAQQPNQRWVSDVTCFKLGEHYFYICVIIDLFSRKVIAHKISKRNSTQLITATFKMAYEERHPSSGLIFHSDRGAQYTSHRFQQILHEHNTEQSFSQPGKPYDNAVAESFFASLKKEELYRKDHPSDRAFQASIASYIEFYNNKRPHRIGPTIHLGRLSQIRRALH